jgi:hypothetical protein
MTEEGVSVFPDARFSIGKVFAKLDEDRVPFLPSFHEGEFVKYIIDRNQSLYNLLLIQKMS